MRKIKYGGQLVPGDFIAIAYSNTIDFGWYCGDGRGTLQYYSFKGPGITEYQYNNWENTEKDKRASWETKRFEKGFTRKLLYKSYINAVHDTRVVKITNIEDIFTEQEDREMYEKSKEALIKLNFIKQ